MGTLTRREREVAELVARGLTNRDIALRLKVSVRTAEYHVEQIRNKLGLASRRDISGDLARRAADAGIESDAALPPGAGLPVRYARSGEVNVAFQVVGSGTLDLIVVPGWVSHLEHMWRLPAYAAYMYRLARFARVILFDKRATGLSDRVRVGALSDRADDIRAVMDAVGSRRAVVYGISEGGPLAMMFAATHPERVSHLVIYGSFARMIQADDYPAGVPRPAWDQQTEFTERNWPVVDLERWAPSVADDDAFRTWMADMRRNGASPGSARELMQVIGQVDVRPLLGSISAPTLVLHRSRDATIPIEMGSVIAQGIPGAEWRELAGADHLPWTGDVAGLVGEIEEFVTGARAADAPDRVLATVVVAEGEVSGASLDEVARHPVGRFGGRLASIEPRRVVASFSSPARAIQCGRALQAAAGGALRVGVHAGECQIAAGKLSGLPLLVSERIAMRAHRGEILVSGTVRDLLAGADFELIERGSVALPEVPIEWRLYAA